LIFDHLREIIMASEEQATSFLSNCLVLSKLPCVGGSKFDSLANSWKPIFITAHIATWYDESKSKNFKKLVRIVGDKGSALVGT